MCNGVGNDQQCWRKLTSSDPDYPRNLSRFPSKPELWAWGAIELLRETRMVAIIGTRHPDEAAEESAQRLARELAARGWIIVSGYAPGIDRAAFRGALEAEGGRTIAVLAEGFPDRSLSDKGARARSGSVKRLDEILEHWPGRVLFLTQFKPGTPWAGSRAMARNAIVVELARAVIVVQAGPERSERADGKVRLSGTWDAVNKASKRQVPVFCVKELLDKGETRKLVEGPKQLARAVPEQDLPDEVEKLMTKRDVPVQPSLLVENLEDEDL